MSVSWTIGGQSLADIGLEFAGGTFRHGAASEMTLRRSGPFDASPLYSYDQAVTLVRDGVPYFSGKVKSRPSYGRANSEGQAIFVVDAWQDLEDTIYLEPWAVGIGSFDFPIGVLGVSTEGAAISTGTQIEEALTFAISAGVDIQIGSIPAGLPLWPHEVRNVSVAEVIRLSMRFTPDWSPWLDHSTSPPTLNITPRATLTSRTISVAGEGDVTDFNVARRDDLKPEAVRITYTNASIIDGEVYRDGILDKYPGGGPTSGPRVLSTVIELAGGQMQFQKQRIQTRTLPTDQDSAKVWLKLKYPHLKDVPDAHMAVSGFEKTLIEETEELPDPVNPRATRLEPDDVDDLPRELVRGQIEDWMQRKVGKVRIVAKVRAAGGASAASKAAIAKGCPPLTVVATNAVTKTYKGVTSWVAPESAPTGIAQAVYESLSTYQFEGNVTITQQDVTATRYHGCKINLSGGLGEWATMGAPVHSVSFDIDAGSVTISFGPAPYLAAEDFLELQRMLRGRTPTWMSEDERTSNELGAENDPGSKGDTVNGFDIPETVQDPEPAISGRFTPYIGGDDGTSLFFTPGTVSYLRVATEDPGDSAPTEGQQHKPVFPTIDDTPINDDEPPSFDIGARSSCSVWLIVDRMRCPGATFVPSEDSTATERIELKNKGQKPEKQDGELHLLLCELDFEDVDGGGKEISEADIRVASDVAVWFKCLSDESSGSVVDGESIGSSDVGPSDESDDDDSSGDSVDCPWAAKATWWRKKRCYEENQRTLILWRVTIGLSTLLNKCAGGWEARITMPGGLPIPYAGQRVEGATLVVTLASRTQVFGAQFRFTYPPACVDTALRISIFGDDGDDSTPHECCGRNFVKTIPERWPHYCGKSCTTIVPPPP